MAAHLSARRCRTQRKRRDFLLRMFCEKHLDGAWSPITKRVLEQRLRGVEGKLASPHALVQCLRHIIAHRGYSYHLKSDGAFLWGDSPKFSDAKNWLKAAYCDGEVARLLQQQAEDLEWSDEQTEDFAALCEEAVRNSEGRSIEATLKLAESTNAKVVVVGGAGTQGLPLILDTGGAAAPTPAPDPARRCEPAQGSGEACTCVVCSEF